MTNSKLVSYTKISPHKNVNRNHKIDTITIHCYVGQATVESMGAWFANPNAHASCNYGIGVDGRIGMFVEEKDRSWCSSSSSNDNRAITIECASDKTEPYAINDKVYASLIKLCADICKRNGIKELKWKADKSLIGKVDKQNMTVHRWFANKSCPGEYIYSRYGQIADEVNALLNGETVKTQVKHCVQAGAFEKKTGAKVLLADIKAAGFKCYITKQDSLYRVQVGSFNKKTNAKRRVKALKEAGFESIIKKKIVKVKA